MNRLKRARTLAQAGMVKPIDRDPEGRIKTAFVPGSEAKLYYVILRRKPWGIETECLVDTGRGNLPCKGNYKVPCYHSLAVILAAGMEANAKLSVCRDLEDAKRLSRIGGKYFAIKPRGNGNPLYILVRKEKQHA